MFGAPSIVPVVGCRALIAPVSYVQWLLEAVGASVSLTGQGVSRAVRRDNSTLVVSVDHTVSSLNAAHRSQKSSFRLTADKIVGYKGSPSILRDRAWGNEGLDELEVP